jgi:hypothetical protein
LVSEGDDVARRTTFDVEVFAYEEETKPTGGSDQDDDDDSSSSNDGLTVESNPVPGFMAVEALSMLAAVVLIRRKKSFD